MIALVRKSVQGLAARRHSTKELARASGGALDAGPVVRVFYKRPDLWAFLRFGLSGAPAFALAVVVNIFFVGRLHWPKPAAYALVVWMQMTCGFLMCRYVVFAEGREIPPIRAYGQFLASMSVIRVADWCLYTLAVEFFRLPYVVAQIATMAIFIVIKFVFAQAIFKNKVSENE